MTIAFPGRIIQQDENDASVVTRIQQALALRGYGPFKPGVFDEAMVSAVKQFQAQNVDGGGEPLRVDGQVGYYTWGALFSQPPAVPMTAPSTLMLHAMAIASTQVGQMEVPLASNRGPMVDEYLKIVGIDPVRSTIDQRQWCMAFVYWAFKTAAASLIRPCPLPRTAGCLDHWDRAVEVSGARRIAAAEAYANPRFIKPGLVERVAAGGRLITIEGNTNAEASRTGVGVFRLDRRKLSDAHLKGFIDYSGV